MRDEVGVSEYVLHAEKVVPQSEVLANDNWREVPAKAYLHVLLAGFRDHYNLFVLQHGEPRVLLFFCRQWATALEDVRDCERIQHSAELRRGRVRQA